ncbi:hypothetical protein D3C84_937410 [compost metagenome]
MRLELINQPYSVLDVRNTPGKSDGKVFVHYQDLLAKPDYGMSLQARAVSSGLKRWDLHGGHICAPGAGEQNVGREETTFL